MKYIGLFFLAVMLSFAECRSAEMSKGKAQPDPNLLPDPFFKNPIHKSKWYSHLLKCLDVDSSLMKEYPLPSGLTLDTVYRDLWRDPIAPSDSEVEIGCNVYAIQWKVQKDSAFLIFFESTYYFDPAQGGLEDIHKLRIGLYRRDSEGNLKMAAAIEPLELENNERVTRSLEIETFKLTENRFAFGVRMESHFYSTRYREGHNSSLTLFKVEANAISPILSTLISSYCHGVEDSGEWEENSGYATIAVRKQKTRGVFDLRKSVKGKNSAIFKWTGSAYELHGKDPVTDVN